MAIAAAQLAPDVINLHMPYPPGDLVARGVQGRPPLVVTYHSDIVRQQRLLRIYRPVLEATLAAAARIIVTSGAYRDSSQFLRPHHDRCRVVPLAVDAGRFATFDPVLLAELRSELPGPLILSVGVLRYYKGLHILLQAMQGLEATLIVVGGGPEAPRLRAQAAELGIVHQVHFAGRVENTDLPSYYQAADLFVLASHLRAEAFGIVLLEAMAAGLPLVTTELGTGTSEVNRHGHTGFVVAPNDPRVLTRALSVLLADQRLREYFGQNGRRLAVEVYAPAKMAERTAAVYREALAAQRRGRQANKETVL
jgi:rhamnosyl/mannosyltransferase